MTAFAGFWYRLRALAAATLCARGVGLALAELPAWWVAVRSGLRAAQPGASE